MNPSISLNRCPANYCWHNYLPGCAVVHSMKSKIERIKTSLQIEEDINLHVTGWIFQRIGWLLMLAFLVCAALGLFGDGLLSEKVLTAEGSTMTYERFSRVDSETEIEILSQSVDGSITAVISDSFFKSFDLEKMIPEPDEQKLRNGSQVYVFTADGQGEITLMVKPKKSGNMNHTIRINNSDFEVISFIYP
jgi:hypothetical protein